jgi:hypothetical protein
MFIVVVIIALVPFALGFLLASSVYVRQVSTLQETVAVLTAHRDLLSQEVQALQASLAPHQPTPPFLRSPCRCAHLTMVESRSGPDHLPLWRASCTTCGRSFQSQVRAQARNMLRNDPRF